MGCSPSKGKLFLKPEGSPKASLGEAPQDGANCRPVEVENTCLKTEAIENELPLPDEGFHTNETDLFPLASDAKSAPNLEETKETEVNMMPQEIITHSEQTKVIKKTAKRKKSKCKKTSTENHRKSYSIQTKVDFPPHMVRAHQAAYNFLNPNISKYESLLGLLDQAAQTQSSLRPMMSALVLRFEEINQALEEMADEGELMLKEHGDCMTLPSGMMCSANPRTGTTCQTDPPPDLLQQLLQQSSEKMKLMGGSVQALGDTTLEEAAEYFSSLYKVLIQKLQTKQAAERRLAQVLAQIEGAAMIKSNPEDSTLHSEDSGIGGENESLTGSERHRRHRGSAGSGSCGSGVNVQTALDSLPSNLPNLGCHDEDDDEDNDDNDDYDDDDDDEENEEDESDTQGRKRSNSSPPDPSQAIRYMHANYTQDQQATVKRALTAAIITKSEHLSFTRCGMTELQKSQEVLDQRIKKLSEIQGNKEFARPHYHLYRAGLRRHSLNGSSGAHKGSLRTNQPSCSLPIIGTQSPKRHSVRRLIHTFSQGVDGRPGQSLANIPPHIRKPRKSGILQLSDTANGKEESSVISGNNNNNNSWPDSRDELDVDNLPPPPPEVLMDDSFQSTQVLPGTEERLQEVSFIPPVINQKTGVSHRLKASIHNVEVLPNRVCVRPRSTAASPAHPVRQDAVTGAQDMDQQPEADLDMEMKKTNNLYQKACKIIHLRDAAESSEKINIVEPGSRASSPLQATIGRRCNSNEFYEGEISPCSVTVIAPPVSRVRLPPSCPTTCKRFPSPPAFRPQSTSRPSSRPNSPRIVTHATDNKTEEIIPSVSFRDARSVFCQNEFQNSKAFGSSVLPRIGGEVSRGRLSTRGTDSSTRRTQSDHRPRGTLHSEFLKDDTLASVQDKGSEPTVTKYRLRNPLMTGDDKLDTSAHVMTVQL